MKLAAGEDRKRSAWRDLAKMAGFVSDESNPMGWVERLRAESYGRDEGMGNSSFGMSSRTSGNPRILVVDDESSLRTALFRLFDRLGFHVVTANSRREAEMLSSAETHYDLAIIDLRLPDGDGLELMQALRQMSPSTQFIILTGHGTIETAVRATQMGAFHFLTKPFNMEELQSLAGKALSLRQLQSENQQLRSALSKRYKFDNIIGQSEEIRKVLHLVERVADSDSTVLISGESGTGKELIAKAIHYNSPRANKAFVPINCGAIPGDLLESELFGHIKGAFTGAINTRVGRFDLAHGGTIFLDEIGELSLSLQVKLLRVLQERRFEPVGSAKTHEVDVRVIAATNVDLAKAVQKGQFREDLFYRLNVIPITIPALRVRRDDIQVLLAHFVQHFNQNKGRNLTGFSPEALDILSSYNWPGNVRELENLVERLAILKGQGQVQPDDLPEHYRSHRVSSSASMASGAEPVEVPDDGMDFNTAVDSYENALILQALQKTGWNRNQAAALLKLNRTTLVEKIKKKGLRPPGEASI
jgi:DNA-binding NtrC family response regulator